MQGAKGGAMKALLQKWLGIDRIQSQGDNFAEAHRNILHTHRELLDKLVDFQSQMCKEYIELKDRLEALEKELEKVELLKDKQCFV